MMGRQMRFVVPVFTVSAALLLTACGPAVQPMNTAGTTSAVFVNPQKTGTLVSPAGWLTLQASAQAGARAQYYREQMSSTMVQGSLHSGFSLYGSLNPPDRVSLALQEGNTSTYYYQQGQVAYYEDNGRWSSTTPIANVNVFPSYEKIISQASAENIPLYQQKRTYVFDEYCNVYTSVLPAAMFTSLPAFGGTGSSRPTGQVAVTWYVGQTDHILRRVDTQSVGGVPDIGSMQVSTSTLVYDINSPIAKVSIPTALVKQLENSTK